MPHGRLRRHQTFHRTKAEATAVRKEVEGLIRELRLRHEGGLPVLEADDERDLERIQAQARAVGLGVADYSRSVVLADAGAAEASAVRISLIDEESLRVERVALHHRRSMSEHVRAQVLCDALRMISGKPPGGSGEAR